MITAYFIPAPLWEKLHAVIPVPHHNLHFFGVNSDRCKYFWIFNLKLALTFMCNIYALTISVNQHWFSRKKWLCAIFFFIMHTQNIKVWKVYKKEWLVKKKYIYIPNFQHPAEINYLIKRIRHNSKQNSITSELSWRRLIRHATTRSRVTQG